MEKNYYVILGISSDATPEEIRSAYRQRVQELHPDHYGANAEPFLAVQEAYEALINSAQRKQYEQDVAIRRRGSGRRARAEAMRGYGPRAEPMRAQRRTPPRDISLTEDFETYAPSFDELFDRFWNNFSDVTRPKAEEIQSLTVDVPLSMEQARAGGRVRIMIPARATCPTCRGRGGVGPYECWRCAGHGSVTADYPLEVPYPAGIFNEYAVQLPLEDFGIDNFYLTVRFRVTASAW